MSGHRITNRPFDYCVQWQQRGNGPLGGGKFLNAATPFEALQIVRRLHLRANCHSPICSINLNNHCIESRRLGDEMTYARIRRVYQTQCLNCQAPIGMAEDPARIWHPVDIATTERDDRVIYTRHRCGAQSTNGAAA